jgi:hypothetical protein
MKLVASAKGGYICYGIYLFVMWADHSVTSGHVRVLFVSPPQDSNCHFNCHSNCNGWTNTGGQTQYVHNVRIKLPQRQWLASPLSGLRPEPRLTQHDA